MDFENWMRSTGLSESSIDKYNGAINGVLSGWALLEGIISSGSLSDITDKTLFDSISIEISKLPVFLDRNNTGHHMYSSALTKYGKFLSTVVKKDSMEMDIDNIVINDKIENTDKATLIKARIGQGQFRQNLIKLWGKCSVTDFSDIRLLKASHIKPWCDSSNSERLDPYNGLLLTPNLDALFDAGIISFNNDQTILISNALTQKNKEILNINPSLKLSTIFDETIKYLDYHRNELFNKF